MSYLKYIRILAQHLAWFSGGYLSTLEEKINCRGYWNGSVVWRVWTVATLRDGLYKRKLPGWGKSFCFENQPKESRQYGWQLGSAFTQNARWNTIWTVSLSHIQLRQSMSDLMNRKYGRGIKLLGGGLGGGWALESPKVELFWKRVLKAKRFSNGEVATESLGKIRGGIKEFEKLLEIF